MESLTVLLILTSLAICHGFSPVVSGTTLPDLPATEKSKVMLCMSEIDLSSDEILQQQQSVQERDIFTTQSTTVVDIMHRETRVHSSSERTFSSAIFTKQDSPVRAHAVSSAVFTFVGGAWLVAQWAAILDLFALDDDFLLCNNAALNIIFVAGLGLIYTGIDFLPKSSRYEHYRRTFKATGAIMVADTILWFYYASVAAASASAGGGSSHAGGLAATSSSIVTDYNWLAVPIVVAAVGFSLLGELQFIVNDDNNRKEAFDTHLISEAIAAPIWKYIVIAPTHITTSCLKIMGAYHVVSSTSWLESHPEAAAFGSAMYLSCSLLAAWSGFTQGTMTLRRAPAFGKEVFRLENDVVTWGIFTAVFLPLLMTFAVGWSTGTLQEFFVAV